NPGAILEVRAAHRHTHHTFEFLRYCWAHSVARETPCRIRAQLHTYPLLYAPPMSRGAAGQHRAWSLHGRPTHQEKPQGPGQMLTDPNDDGGDELSPQFASPILLRNTSHRGSACRERSNGWAFIPLSPGSRWAYARSSHSKARSVSPRAA